MATLLYKLGAWSAQHRRAVVAGWMLTLVILGALAGTVSGTLSSSITIPGTEAQKGIDLLSDKFPGTGGAAARVVVAAPAGQRVDEPRYVAAAQESLAEVAKAPQVLGVTALDKATVSKDGRIAYVDVQYDVSADKISDNAKDALQAAAKPATDAGLQVEFSGGVVSTTTAQGHSSELYGIIIAFIVLTITFGAFVAAGMPLLMAIVGVGVALLGITALSGAVELSETTPALAVMLGLAVGIDYTLFILSRHRQQLRDGMAVHTSIALATATAGGSVVFAGLTVIIALCALTVVGIPFLTAMGLAAAATVAVTVLISLTLLPAVLSMLGTRVNKGSIGFLTRRQDKLATSPTMGERWERIAVAKPWVTVVACVLGLGIISAPLLNLDLGLPDDSSKSTSTTERRAYDLLTEGFGAGFNGPLTIVAYAPGRTDLADQFNSVIPELERAADVASVSPAIPNQTGDVAIVTVTPESSPSSTATKDLVGTIRSAAEEVRERTGVTTYVTGQSAVNIDVSDKLTSALPIFIAVIVILALLLLLVVFRSILVPIKAVIGYLLSLGASFGATAWIFQEGHLGSLFNVETPGPVVSFLPILIVGILFGLAMDYEVFLVSRIHEDYGHTSDPNHAIAKGMSTSARVVTAAALIMLGVFGGFVFGDDPVIKSLGFALAFGVLVDAFVVRMTLVPAILKILGHKAWALPGFLDKRLPKIDLEGNQLANATSAAPPETNR